MREHMRDDARFGAPECPEVELRDALPALEHGRLSDADRQRLERHLNDCEACEAELALLRDVRMLTTSGAPVLDLDRLAAAVSGATVRPRPHAVDERVVSLAAHRERSRGRTRPAWMARLPGGAGLRAAAALLVAAVGGAVLGTRSGESGPEPSTRTRVVTSTQGPSGEPRLTGDTTGHALGDRFGDLSEDELSAVLVALEGDDAALPALEPAMLAPEYRGGGE